MSQPVRHQPIPPAPAPAPPRARKWPWILGIVAAFIVGIIIGAASAGSGQSQNQAAARTTTQAQPAGAQPNPTTAAPAPPPKPAGPLTQFGDGKYLVGTDVAAGSYKTTGPRAAGGQCYWARLKDDSGSNIIANDLTEGPTRLTTKAGEYLEIRGCDFAKA